MTTGLSERQTAKREQIATAARKLFLELGYAGTSMDAVSAEAGVSKQTLYTYFPAKVDLLKAILDAELSQIELDGVLPQPQTLPELRQLLLRFAQRLTRSLPRPFVCDSAKTTTPSFTPSRASFSTTSFVEAVCSNTRMSRPMTLVLPRRATRSSACSTSGALTRPA